jgi:hypothetical protein
VGNSILDAVTQHPATRRIAAMTGLAILGTTAFLMGAATNAQDATKVDPKHYKVLLENDQVRVLRIVYGPHEKSVMHSHPPGVVVYLTDARGRFTMPGGKIPRRSDEGRDGSVDGCNYSHAREHR